MLGCVLYELCALERPFQGNTLHVSISKYYYKLSIIFIYKFYHMIKNKI